MPTGRLGSVNELSNLACYLVSDYASWITGSVRNNSKTSRDHTICVYLQADVTCRVFVRLQVFKFDGGEFNSMAGEFNELRNVEQQQWDMIESMIRKGNKGSADQ